MNMKKVFSNLRQTLISGLVFLLPILILMVVVTKVFGMLTGISNKLASIFGIKSIVGISASTISSSIALILLCLLCGYLVRFAFAQRLRNWIDNMLMANVPGYEIYKKTAMSKLEPAEEALPYKAAVWVESDGMKKPGFLIDHNTPGDCIIFFPTAGKPEEGTTLLVPGSRVHELPNVDMIDFRKAIANKGIGLEKF
jgi:uncharacterized membrane protein